MLQHSPTAQNGAHSNKAIDHLQLLDSGTAKQLLNVTTGNAPKSSKARQILQKESM